jgi:hypothetical protein
VARKMMRNDEERCKVEEEDEGGEGEESVKWTTRLAESKRQKLKKCVQMEREREQVRKMKKSKKRTVVKRRKGKEREGEG